MFTKQMGCTDGLILSKHDDFHDYILARVHASVVGMQRRVSPL
jgi:hypothetical protein